MSQSQLVRFYERRYNKYFMAMAPEEHSPFKCEAIFQGACQSEVFNRCKMRLFYCLWKYKELEMQLKYSSRGQYATRELRAQSVFIQFFLWFFFPSLSLCPSKLLRLRKSMTSQMLFFHIFPFFFFANFSQYLTFP